MTKAQYFHEPAAKTEYRGSLSNVQPTQNSTIHLENVYLFSIVPFSSVIYLSGRIVLTQQPSISRTKKSFVFFLNYNSNDKERRARYLLRQGQAGISKPLILNLKLEHTIDIWYFERCIIQTLQQGSGFKNAISLYELSQKHYLFFSEVPIQYLLVS